MDEDGRKEVEDLFEDSPRSSQPTIWNKYGRVNII